MDEAVQNLQQLEDGVEQARQSELAVEELTERARALRAEAGLELDRLGRELSQARGQLEQLASRRIDLQSQHELALKRRREGTGDQATVETLMWELASVEEELRQQGSRCDELEYQLAERQRRLDRDNDELDPQIAKLGRVLDEQLSRLERLAAELGAPLALAEEYVVSAWEKAFAV
jgi:hypothetical protein